jgi:hypothetical protein
MLLSKMDSLPNRQEKTTDKTLDTPAEFDKLLSAKSMYIAVL